jgi:predicted NBD/HSP70 family sugar kinase
MPKLAVGFQLKARHRRILHALWCAGPMSRWELHERTGVRANTVGEDADMLVQAGILRECEPQQKSTGRPSVPLGIDPSGFNVLGISIQPDNIGVAQLNLLGELLGQPDALPLTDPTRIEEIARDLLLRQLSDRTLAVGITTTGKYDTERRVLLGSWVPGWKEISLHALYEAIGPRPVLLRNDMQGLCSRWVLHNNPAPNEHVLLVALEDTNVGGSLLVNTHTHVPYTLHNELGHTRLFVETDRCYCGHTGCLTQLCSTAYLRRLDPQAPSLAQAAAQFDGTHPATQKLVEYVGAAVGNIANTVYVDRVVLVSSLFQHAQFAQALVEQIRGELLFLDHGRQVDIGLWNEPVSRPAETAAWQALVGLYVEG